MWWENDMACGSAAGILQTAAFDDGVLWRGGQMWLFTASFSCFFPLNCATWVVAHPIWETSWRAQPSLFPRDEADVKKGRKNDLEPARCYCWKCFGFQAGGSCNATSCSVITVTWQSPDANHFRGNPILPWMPHANSVCERLRSFLPSEQSWVQGGNSGVGN